MLDTSKDIITDSMAGRCLVPITYFPSDEYKHLIEKNPSRINNKLFVNCCEKLFFMYNALWQKASSEVYLVPKEMRYLILGSLNFFSTEQNMMRAKGIYRERRLKLSIFMRCLYILKWAYFAPSIESLKFTMKS